MTNTEKLVAAKAKLKKERKTNMEICIIQLFGGFDNLLLALVAFIFIDYITSILATIVKRKWFSDKLGLKSLFRKIAIFILVSVANIIDTLIIMNDFPIRTVVILFYLSNEGLIILENLRRLDMVLPKILEKIIKQLNQDEKDS